MLFQYLMSNRNLSLSALKNKYPDLPLQNLDYAWLGRVLYKVNPEVAEQLITYHYSTGTIPEKDTTKIKIFFLHFCAIQGIEPSECTGNLKIGRRTDMRKYFIAAILHLYRPSYFAASIDPRYFRDGVSQALQETLQVGKDVISKSIRQIVIWEKIDDQFRQRVENIVNHLKERED